MLISLLFLILGLVLLIAGAGWLVDGASGLAKRLRIPDLAIGLTIVAFGTSAPELVVNAFASFREHQDIIFGNVIGSNNFNLFIVLGITGLITPIAVQSSTVWKEIPLSLLAAIILFVFLNYTNTGMLDRPEGMFLLMLFGLFLFYVYKQLRTDSSTEATKNPPHTSLLKLWGCVAGGLGGLIYGGHLVVTHAVEIATLLGITEKVIGLTVIAAGTSLPELATSVIAAIKKKNDIAVGNIVGSNIFNILLILPVSSLIRPLSYDFSFNTDLYILAGGTIFLFAAMFTSKKKKLDRWEAAVLLIFYLVYTAYLVYKES